MPSAPAAVADLVERYLHNRDLYHRADYNETQVRREFLDPLFEALGWDVANHAGNAPQYREVVHEAALRERGGGVIAPDYAFRVGTEVKFYVEAKKPSVDIRSDPSPAYQLRRYAWTASRPLSVLTDFEEFAVYDCRYRPAAGDAAGQARVQFLTCDQYPDRWEEIASIFGREAVWRGDFDRFAESSRTKRGTQEVGDAFLQEIESWRVALARNIALRNPDMGGVRELNYAVGKVIDRIIFLRICEDRDIEPYGRLQEAGAGAGVYPRLVELFRQADARYNSGLFHLAEERGRSEPVDTLTPRLAVDDRVLRDIISGLYYPASPYEFSIFGADVLGNVYERFLGSVIRLTPAHHAVVELKPEVRKAGGVYYTPRYIVAYIVEHTVGALLEDKTPGQVASLRILDPACGSGSFLLGAYQYLLDWHLRWYTEHPTATPRRETCPGPNGEPRLTSAEKKRILLNSIYGVDVDPQAVEVTKLSLLLKVLEGETASTLQLAFLPERALPDLGANIQCGNSLIGSDYFAGAQLSLTGGGAWERVNPLDWDKAFPAAMAAGGFDAVIGNPPYIRIQTLREWAPQEVDFYSKRYAAAAKGNYDIYVVFVEKGLSLLNPHGRLGFILPSKFMATEYGAGLRSLLTNPNTVDRIVDFGHSQVFGHVSTYTCLLFLDRSSTREVKYIAADPNSIGDRTLEEREVSAEALGTDGWILDRDNASMMRVLSRKSTKLLEIPALMSRGSSTGADDVFCLAECDGHLRTRDGNPIEVEEDILRRPLFACDFGRYAFAAQTKERILFPYKVTAEGYFLLPESELRVQWPKAYAYLRSKRKALEARKQYQQWFGFSAPRNLNLHDLATFLVPLLANRGAVSPAPAGSSTYCLMASAGFSVGIGPAGKGLHPHYVLGLVNSKALFWYLRKISNRFRGGWITCTKQYFGQLPIRTIDFTDPADVARHDRMVALVERMLALHEELATARASAPGRVVLLDRQIAATDAEIDRLVYALYDLTAEEIRLVEGEGE